MKSSIFTMVLAFFFGMQTIRASVQTDIEAANKAGKVVFLLVTEPANLNYSTAANLAKEAHKLYPKSAVIEMNRADVANRNLVSKYGLTTAPVPLVLVIATNGSLAGGAVYNQTNAQKLVSMVPSPKKADVLEALQSGKAVFLIVSKKSTKKAEVISKCQKACTELKEKAKIVEVDFDNAKEKQFMDELKIVGIGDVPQTYVINAKGQIAGAFSGTTDSKILVATATKQISGGGCCAPGSGKTCAPPAKPKS